MQSNTSARWGDDSAVESDPPGGREPGSRRRKLAGYLKAANELRQSYQQSYSSSWTNRGTNYEDTGDENSTSFADAAVVRSGEEEMIVFPSYASRHIKVKPEVDPATLPKETDTTTEEQGRAGDAEYWKKQWEQYEDDNAIVDVNVRGWIYTPHSGPMGRKHRIFVSLARQLVGISSPPDEDKASSRSSSPHSNHHQRYGTSESQREEELVSREARSILTKGEVEAAVATKGGYSEKPSRSDGTSDQRSRANSAVSEAGAIDTDIRPISKRPSWNQPADMTPKELAAANEHLMSRLKPFLANPAGNTPISVFFYNDKISRQRTVHTNSSGHFNVRAALEFVPTHVRILASERLSVTEEVKITEPTGVSVISDIDDTIKHSAISSGAREIFRNAFIRELGDLTVTGVKEWYTSLYDAGARFHYVSNSPWQLFPVLTSFFSLSGLPPGSFHLKQYTGMFQGIFEPVAERKKGTLDKIAQDFPERRFILVGDSGEADLEVYTDFVLENPGRVLAVFIRDVTTPANSGFFDSSMGSLTGERSSDRKAQSTKDDDANDPDLKAAIAASLKDLEHDGHSRNISVRDDTPENRPQLPPRQPSTTPASTQTASKLASKSEKLIDFSDDESTSTPDFQPRSAPITESNDGGRQSFVTTAKAKPPPPLPRKPASLRSNSGDGSIAQGPNGKPLAPPKPTRTSSSVTNNSRGDSGSNPPQEPRSYASSAKQKLVSAYNQLPSSSSYWYDNEKASETDVGSAKRAPPPPPARRTVTAYPVAAAQFASTKVSNLYNAALSNAPSLSSNPYSASSTDLPRSGGNYSGRSRLTPNPNTRVNSSSETSLTSTGAGTGHNQAPNKRIDLWNRRWERAQQVLAENGVVLRAWRVGTDALEESIQLVENEKKKYEQEKQRLENKVR